MYRVAVESENGLQCRATANSGDFVLGQDGVGPVDAFLSGLCACVAHHVHKRAAARKIVFRGLTVAARAELSGDGLSLARLFLTLELCGGVLTDDDRAELVRQAARCPLYNALDKKLPVDVSVV